MNKLLPILNFDFGETPVLSAEDEKFFYLEAVKALAKSFEEIEISFVSDAFVFNAKEILSLMQSLGLKLCVGSIYEPEQISELKRIFKEANFKQGEIKIFSPVYSEVIDEILLYDKTYNFKYIPAIFKKSEFRDELKIKTELKVFPFSIDSAKSLYLKLCKPYPELRKHLYIHKILFASEELVEKYKIFEDIKIDEYGAKYIVTRSGEEVFIVESPYDYQIVRSRFLFNPKTKIFFSFKDKINQEDLLELAAERHVYLTGIKASQIDDEILTCTNITIATNIFQSVLKDMLAGHVNSNELQDIFAREIETKKGCD